jgi:ZIP family zinc transporter
VIDYLSLIVLGAIAGFTIFLGLPIAFLQHLSHKQKGFLTAFALGILIFLTIDVFSHSWEFTEDIVKDAFGGSESWVNAILALTVFLGGVSIGLLGLAIYERKSMTNRVPNILTLENIQKGDDHLLQVFNKTNAYRLAMMISIGIGAHNFSEGLAIGQSYISGEIALAMLLIVGFGIHNATEGFGIAGPLTGLIKRPSIKFLFLLGIIGGGPTFLGTILGGLWISDFAYILFLSAAGGSLIYVSMLMYNTGRKQTTNLIMMLGILIGLCAGFLTDLVVAIGKA